LVLGISKTSKNFQVLWNLKALVKTWPLFCDYLPFFQKKEENLGYFKNKVLDIFIITIIYENQVLDFWYSWTWYMVRSLMQFISTHIGNNLHNFYKSMSVCLQFKMRCSKPLQHRMKVLWTFKNIKISKYG